MVTFPEFWSLYPRRVAKKAAEKAWIKADGDKIGDDIIAGLKKQLPYWTDARFIPHPASWLNAGRWADEVHVDVRPAAPYAPREIHAPWKQLCAWRAMMNVWLFGIVRECRGVEPERLQELLAERNRLADQCRQMWGDAVPDQRDTAILGGMLDRLRTLAKAP